MRAGPAVLRRVSGRTPVALLPASDLKRPAGIDGKTSDPPETSSPKVCSFQLPLTRGSHEIGDRRRLGVGSIPAGAGKPGGRAGRAGRSAVYPRGRGEARRIACGSLTCKGLSPRARGSQWCDTPERRRTRSIPVGAGKPRQKIETPGSLGVYPRGRGEASYRREIGKPIAGLSPRARGSHAAAGRDRRRPGFIPAGAGKPSGVQSLPSPNRVYPRGRGEATRRKTARGMKRGLSPRARGSRLGRGGLPGAAGSIPAGAGKPKR